MTREERENAIKVIKNYDLNFFDVNKVLFSPEEIANAFDCALEALEQEPCSNCIEFKRYAKQMGFEIEQEPKQGHCKDCKWWKDSDGSYRRGVSAESICPINTKTVLDGKGYCYLFSKNE